MNTIKITVPAAQSSDAFRLATDISKVGAIKTADEAGHTVYEFNGADKGQKASAAISEALSNAGIAANVEYYGDNDCDLRLFG